MENERRMLLDRIEPLEQRLPSAGALEAMAQRLLRVEQQCSVRTAHPLEDAAVDVAGGSTTLIPRLDALESTCQALQLLHDKNALGNSLEAASIQQGFAQLRSCMEVLQEFLQVGLAEECVERTKTMHEAKQRVDECFETVDGRLAGIVNCCIGDGQSELSANDHGYARLVGELKAEFRAEMASHIRTLAMERGEILGEVAACGEKNEACLKLLETQLTGDLKRIIEDLRMRIDRVEDEVKRNSKLVTEREVRTAGVAAIQAIERDTPGALPEEDAKHGSTCSCLPKHALVRSASSNGIVDTQNMPLAPVDRNAAGPRSKSHTDADSGHSNSCWQPPLVRTSESSLGEKDLKNIEDGLQRLQGLVSIPEENEDESTVKIVSQYERRPTDGSSKSHSPPQKFRTAQELPAVTNQLDSETSTSSQPAVWLRSSIVSAATPSIVSRRPDIESIEMALSQKLAQLRSSQQTTNSMSGSASAPTWASCAALRPRITTMEVEPTHQGGASPLMSPAMSVRSFPTRQNLMKQSLSSAHISPRFDVLATKATTAATQQQSVICQPTS